MSEPLLKSSERIPFFKMSGSGNDFIIIDNRSLGIEKERAREIARRACRHKLSVGADGLILIENDPEVDFKWVFFNADGSEAEMCGNGSRCAARFAYLSGIVDKKNISFRTLAGIIQAEILGERVKVLMTKPFGLETDFCVESVEGASCLNFLNTGVPHVVWFVESEERLENIKVFDRGRALRFHPRFHPAGTNVNFAHIRSPHSIAIRTYERGVEDETLACGTGSIACALTASAKGLAQSPVEVLTRSGETLVIYFEKLSQNGTIDFSDVRMEGDAKVVYHAELWDETLRR